MKKIAFVLEEFRGGGAEKSVLKVAQTMVDRGHEVHMFIWGTIFDYIPDPRIRLHRLNYPGFLKRFPFLDHYLLVVALRIAIARYECFRKPFDSIICTVWPANRIVYLSRLKGAVIRIANTPSCEIETLRKLSGDRAAEERRRFYGKMFSHSPLVAISAGVRNDLVRNFNAQPDRVEVIHNPVDAHEIRELAKQAIAEIPDDDYILHVARFAPQKRHDLLLEAFKRLQTGAKLVLLTKVSPELRELIARHGLEDRVICPGFQRNPYPWMARAKVSVLCSDHEGFANVILESLICGTPVVSTDCPSGPSEILAGELSRWLVPMNDPDALAQRIGQALAGEINIPGDLAERFSLELTVNRYLAMTRLRAAVPDNAGPVADLGNELL